jgi:hypothetical protein
MRKIIKQIRTTYGHLSDRMIEEYDRRKYMRFYKGKLEGHEAKVSLATACFYMGQGFGYIRGLIVGLYNGIGSLRTVRRNRLK